MSKRRLLQFGKVLAFNTEMNHRRLLLYFLAIMFIQVQCAVKSTDEIPSELDTVEQELAVADRTGISETEPLPQKENIETGIVTREELISFARTQLGVPYRYASTDPEKGFDCSGFITYVFNHFNIAVPRSSVDFTYEGREVDTTEALPGDLILFTGTDSTDWVVGHMGIVISNHNGKLEFIHSTSGKAYGVVITAFERYYRSRFVKVIRVFP